MKSPLTNPRSCIGCTACCTVLSITDPKLDKPCGVRCEHIIQLTNHFAEGCKLYDTPDKPSVCSTYQCMWTLILDMPDWAKPSQCGVLITVNDMESKFTKVTGLPTFSAYEVWPGAFDTYWADKLLKKLAKHWTMIVLRHGQYSVTDDTVFVGPKKEMGVINAYRARPKL